MPSANAIAVGHSAASGLSPRIMRSLKARMVHVVGTPIAAVLIQPGSNSSGHQHPPTADITMAATEPIGSTESRLGAIAATARPKAAATKAIAAAGSISMAGLWPR